MNFLNNLKIKTRLLVSFSIIILLSAVLGYFASSQITKLGVSGEMVFTKNVKPLMQLDELSSTNAEVRRLVAVCSRTALANPERLENDINALKTKIEDFKKLIQDYKQFQLTVGSSQERIDKFNTTSDIFLNQYVPNMEKVITLLKENKVSEAIKIIDDSAVLGVSVTTGMKELIALNQQAASDTINNNYKEARFTALFVFVATILVIVLSLAVSFLVGNLTSKSIVSLRNATHAIASGNLNVNIASNAKDEVGDLSRDFDKVVQVLKSITSDIKLLDQKHEEGFISFKLDADKYEGGFKEIVLAISQTVDSLISEILDTIEVYKQFSIGNFKADLKKLPNEKAVLNESIDNMRKNLETVNKEINSLVDGAMNGNLSKRANVSGQQGEWLTILSGLNKLMNEIMKPIEEAQKTLVEMSRGNLKVKMEGTYKGDFDIIKSSLNDTINAMSSYIEEIRKVLGEISTNNLNVYITREYVGDFSGIKVSINLIVEKLNEVFEELRSTSEQVLIGSRQVSETSMTLAHGASEQASSIEELNATIDTINEQTKQNAHNAKEADELSTISKESAIEGNSQMQTMLVSMNEIADSSNNISKIIKVIQDIAFQTNLLALNAAVEAARAGVHGKGFAVVAEEVRNLASRSQNAARETTALIQESIARVNVGTELAKSTAEALNKIVDNVSTVSSIIEGISEASVNQAASISEITIGIEQIATVVTQNSSTSEESAAASQELSSQAETLQNMVDRFKLRR